MKNINNTGRYITSLFIIIIILNTDPAFCMERAALIIGNSQCVQSPLKNPVNDATDLASALNELGFSVILKTNSTLEEMKAAISDFGKQLSSSSVGLFYYAGHAMQINGRNYLLPINCSIESESDVQFEAIDAA